MQLVKLAVAALNQTPLDWHGNLARMRRALAEARQAGASLVLMPELCVTGYGCEDAFHSMAVIRTASELLGEIAAETQGLIACIGLPVWISGGLYNGAAVLVDGKLQAVACKQHLAAEGIHYEPRWFRPWPAGHVEPVELGGQTAPAGDLVLDCGGVRLGFEICEDAWVADRPGASLAFRNVDVILNPSASHFAFGKQDVRRRFVLEGARAFGVTYVYANLLGNEAGRAIYDGSSLVASGGQLLVEGPRFSFADVQLTMAVIDVDLTRMQRSRAAGARPKGVGKFPAPIHCRFDFPSVAPQTAPLQQPSWEPGPAVKEEEFCRAVALGLFDYVRKSHSQGFVVSLSGGADSAAVAALVGLSIRLGRDELGPAEFQRKLQHVAGLDACTDTAAVTRKMLACVYQSTVNSSDRTHDIARDVAMALGAEFFHFNVQGAVDAYLNMGREALGRPLDWRHDDIALQNIQARSRAPGVWLLTNLRGALLLATSNRSEAAVGYTTMDGDTCGGLSPIAGIDKAFLRRWLAWLANHGPHGVGPQSVMAQVAAQPPTAELRPPEYSQTDEADLMPYDILDWIERAAIRDKQSPVEIWQRAEKTFPQHAPKTLAMWVERFFKLWTRNQWKRERYAPSFHLDDENLDPKTWCRFPILSGGYEKELAELRGLAHR